MIQNQKTVVIVDDNASVRKSLQRLFQTHEVRVLEYASAEDFLEHGRPEGTACMILDVRLPGSSGLELQEALKGLHELPIVFITGHGDVPVSVRAMKAGAVDFLVKPFQAEELVAAVERALEKDRDQYLARAQEDEAVQLCSRLTPREKQVFGLVVNGLLNKQIAMRLGVSEKTVKVHRGQVMRKLQAGSVPDLVRTFQSAGLGD